MRKFQKTILLILALALLTGCTASIPIKESAGVTLPPIALPYEAPSGDAAESIAQTVLLCLPSAKTGQLEYFPERVLLSPSRHPAELTLRRLFTYAGTTQASPLSSSVQLALNPGSAIEISGDTATVNLAPSALSLGNQERYIISRAIANTLTQWGDIRYVNVLINSRQLGLDTASTIPLSSLGKTDDGDVIALYDTLSQSAARQDIAYTAMATLYYPISSGRGIAARSQLITANSRSLPDMAYALIEALSTRGEVPSGTPAMPDLTTLLQSPITVDESASATGRLVKLNFRESMNEALIASGITRSVMMASLTYTLTTFLPYTAGISVTIGNEQITALVPAGLYDGAGEQILFANGIMQRSQFAQFLLDHCALYFANAQGSLSKTLRAIPYHQMHNPRYVMNQLMKGPLNTDSVTGLSPVLPADIKDADLLGITIQNDTALINFSNQLRAKSAQLTPEQELLMVYAMVNTLTKIRTAKQACFFIDGKQEGMFVQQIDVSGVFLRNEGIIQ
ncbi:MAG: GerMN domain-containing protein [Clostridiales bacterium]|nr:GerMN domain-containing protein [Clostridiales bacterium]